MKSLWKNQNPNNFYDVFITMLQKYWNQTFPLTELSQKNQENWPIYLSFKNEEKHAMRFFNNIKGTHLLNSYRNIETV